MAKDRPGQTARSLLHSQATGKEGRCARSDRRRKPDRRCRKPDRRCRKRRCRFLWVRGGTRVVKRRHTGSLFLLLGRWLHLPGRLLDTRRVFTVTPRGIRRRPAKAFRFIETWQPRRQSRRPERLTAPCVPQCPAGRPAPLYTAAPASPASHVVGVSPVGGVARRRRILLFCSRSLRPRRVQLGKPRS